MSDLVREIYKRLAASAGHPLFQEHRDAIRAISAVLDTHSRSEAQRTFGDRRPVCFECDDGRSKPVWPCQTIKLMAMALNVPSGVVSGTGDKTEPPLSDDDLPGMWSHSDFTGGQTDV